MGAKKKKKDQVTHYSRPKTKPVPAGMAYTGKLELTRSGMGFVVVEGLAKDIMIKPQFLGNALDGDEVRVEVLKVASRNGRMEGSVKQVLKRNRVEFTGVIEMSKHFAFLVPEKKELPFDIYVPEKLLNGAQQGDKAIVKVVEWSENKRNPVGEVIDIITHDRANEIAMKEILVSNGFPLTFPDDVIEESERLSDAITKDDIAARKDLRKELTFTIDPFDAKDFDDAISFKKLKDGWYEVGVHIADVSHFVRPDTALDKEAFRRATSVYLPDRVLPMLPEHISNQLCSLRPNEDKFTFSAVFKINEQGEVKEYWLGKTLTHSDRRFTYEEAQEVIETGEGDHKEEILTLNKISQALRKARFKNGAINFSSQEVRFKLDDAGMPVAVVIKESKEAHQLIEELMLLANKTVAKHVGNINFKGNPVPFPYRVHDVPDEEKLKPFTIFASKFGHKFDMHNPQAIAASFNQMLEQAKGKPEQHVLEQLGIRTMAKAVYTTENIGHYGLAFDDYAHFTSPIRRYPDVLVHRILQECLTNSIHPIKGLEQMCKHCSDQERKAMEAERAGNKYKQVEYMQQFLGEEFDGVISGVAHFGFWVETVEHKCEGLVSLADLVDLDDFYFEEAEYTLVGHRTGLRFRIGDKVRVLVAATNLDKRQIDYQLVPELPKKKKAKTTK